MAGKNFKIVILLTKLSWFYSKEVTGLQEIINHLQL